MQSHTQTLTHNFRHINVTRRCTYYMHEYGGEIEKKLFFGQSSWNVSLVSTRIQDRCFNSLKTISFYLNENEPKTKQHLIHLNEHLVFFFAVRFPVHIFHISSIERTTDTFRLERGSNCRWWWMFTQVSNIIPELFRVNSSTDSSNT